MSFPSGVAVLATVVAGFGEVPVEHQRGEVVHNTDSFFVVRIFCHERRLQEYETSRPPSSCLDVIHKEQGGTRSFRDRFNDICQNSPIVNNFGGKHEYLAFI